MAPLPDEVRELLAGPNFGHVATMLPDGSPHSVAVWVGLEGDHVVFFTQTGSRKARNLAQDPRVAISIVDGSNPYRGANLRGRVAGTVEGDEALEIIDRLADKFTGEPFPMRSGTVYLIEPERVSFLELPFTHSPPG
jgi:PPOX class probable F420-dependent enzyme